MDPIYEDPNKVIRHVENLNNEIMAAKKGLFEAMNKLPDNSRLKKRMIKAQNELTRGSIEVESARQFYKENNISYTKRLIQNIELFIRVSDGRQHLRDFKKYEKRSK